MSLVINLFCKDGLVVGCDSRSVTIYESDTKDTFYMDTLFEQKAYAGKYFILSRVGDSNYRSEGKTCSIRDFAEKLDSLSKSPEDLPFHFMNIVYNSDIFDTSQSITLSFYYNGIPHCYYFRSRAKCNYIAKVDDTKLNKIGKDTNSSIQIDGCGDDLAEAIINGILCQMNVENSYNLSMEQSVYLVEKTINLVSNIFKLADKHYIGGPVLIYTQDKQGIIKKAVSKFEYKEEIIKT